MAVGQLYRGFVVDHVGGYPVAGGGDFHRHGDRYLGKVVAWWEDGRGLARLASPVGTSAGSATEGGQLPFVFYTGRVPEGEASGSVVRGQGCRETEAQVAAADARPPPAAIRDAHGRSGVVPASTTVHPAKGC